MPSTAARKARGVEARAREELWGDEMADWDADQVEEASEEWVSFFSFAVYALVDAGLQM